ALGTSSTYELTSYFESDKYQQTAANSGNPDPTTYAIGSNLSITPFIHGLVGYWPLNEGSGTTAYDNSGWNNNGSLLDAPTWIQGINNGGLYFTTSTQYVSASDYGLQTASVVPITFTAWIKTSNSGIEQVVSSGGNSAMEANRGGQVFLHECTPGDTGTTVNSNINLDDGNWHFIAVSYSTNNNATIFELDNSNVTVTANGQPTSGGSNFLIGDGQCDGNVYTAYPYSLASARIYKTTLTVAQLQAIYNVEKP
ncbi:MAG: hypothetical protein KGJ01_02885, partial [Patescibacteria group bacterium]|nr:hypothetical protein [Patescibacteria group bacterium]